MLVLALALAVPAVTGWQLVIDRSDSMRPTLRAGDLLLLRPADLAGAQPGEILTFPDPTSADRTLTHRLVARSTVGGELLVETRGDANSASETWTAPRDAVVHRVAVRVPHAGRVIAATTVPEVRAAVVTVLVVLAAVAVLRRVWSDPAS